MDKTALADELTKAFITYQYRLENPLPRQIDTEHHMTSIYLTDHIFHRKVDCLVSGVMEVVCRHAEET